jgi:catechol 2,3-dioxygenase-like lactoylglutathione lyase family enzyme
MAEARAVRFVAAATVFVVRDVARSVEHYRDVLGFSVAFTYREPVVYAGVERGSLLIHLQAASETARQPGQGSVYAFVDDVDALHGELAARGARIVKPPQTYDYGMRDFDIRDLDGNQLGFGMEARTG